MHPQWRNSSWWMKEESKRFRKNNRISILPVPFSLWLLDKIKAYHNQDWIHKNCRSINMYITSGGYLYQKLILITDYALSTGTLYIHGIQMEECFEILENDKITQNRHLKVPLDSCSLMSL